MKKALIALALFKLVYSCDIDCNGHGTCSTTNSSLCVCRSLWTGPNCEISWTNNETFRGFFIAYIVYEVLIQLFCGMFASYQLYISLLNSKKRWSMPSLILLGGIVGAILRIIGFSTDAHSYSGLLPIAVVDLLFDLPLIIWLIDGFMLYLFWIEMQSTISTKQTAFVTRFRPVLITFAIVCTVLIIGCDIWFSVVTESTIANTLYNVIFAVMFLLLIVMISYSGYTMTVTMKRLWDHTQNKGYLIFLKKLTRYMFVMDACLVFSVIGLIIYTIIDAGRIPAAWLPLQTLFRSAEFGIISQTIVFISRKKPVSDSSTELVVSSTANTNNSV